MVMTMKNAIFWDVTSCGSMFRLLVTANIPSLPIPVTLIETIHSSKTLVLTRATWR
jgi:hypothetical protein